MSGCDAIAHDAVSAFGTGAEHFASVDALAENRKIGADLLYVENGIGGNGGDGGAKAPPSGVPASVDPPSGDPPSGDPPSGDPPSVNVRCPANRAHDRPGRDRAARTARAATDS